MEGFNQVIDITLNKTDHRCEGIIIGRNTEVECPSNKVMRAIGEVKLVSGGNAAALNCVYQAIYFSIWNVYNLFCNSG